MVEYTVDIAKDAFASDFVDDALCLKSLGGHKQEDRPVWLYLGLPIAGRPQISWFFDQEYYLSRYPDIVEGQIDPLIHFIQWGIGERRSPHPLIDLEYIRAAGPGLLPDGATISDLCRVLSEDLADPSPYFSREYYRSQLPAGPAVNGLLRHFLEHGLLFGLRPIPGFDAIGAYRNKAGDFDLRSSLRALAATGKQEAVEAPEETDLPPVPGSCDAELREVHLYCLAWNEAKMLPHFLRHYSGVADRFFIFDNGSTDETLSLLAADGRVTVAHFDVPGDSFVEEERRLSDTIWRQSRGEARWVIVLDIDEFLYHRDLRGYLDACAQEGVTAIEAVGYEMVSDEFPSADLPLTKTVTCGAREPFYDKLCIFDPNAIASPNYRRGRHTAAPTGRMVWPAQREVKLLHYKRLGVDHVAARYAQLKPGLRPRDLANRWGFQYLMSRTEIEAEFERFRRDAAPVPGLGAAGELDLRLAVDGRVLEPSGVRHNRYTFAPLPGGRAYRLLSLTDGAAQKRAVPVAQIFLRSDIGVHYVAADSPALLEGWSHTEAVRCALVCWTTGDAIISIPPEAGAITAIEVVLRWPLTPPSGASREAEPAAEFNVAAEPGFVRSHQPAVWERHRHLFVEKHRLEGAMQRQPDDIAVRDAYFSCLLQISHSHFGAIFASLPEIRTPLLFRGASSDVLNLTNIFSYAEDPSRYAYGVYGIEMPEPRRILDIGAYCGYTAVYFATRFPDAEIVCIEPPGANFDVLGANTAAYANIRCLPAAIWPRRTHVVAAGHVSGDWGNLYAEAPDPGAPGAFPGYTIDDVLELVGWDRVDFIKCQAENVIIDVLCTGERKWLKTVSCFCAIKPAGRWPRESDGALLDNTFHAGAFNKTVHENGLHVFTRAEPGKANESRAPAPLRLVPPTPQQRPLVPANFPHDSTGFYNFGYFNFQLSPNPPGTPAATLKFRISLHGHTRFRSKLAAGPGKAASVRFHLKIADLKSGTVALDPHHDLNGPAEFDWEIEMPAVRGIYEVAISTEVLCRTEGELWARFIDPRFE